MALRCRLFHPLPTPSTSIISCHLRGGPTLVEKNQLLDLDLTYLLPPRLPALLCLLAVLLLGMERFFLRGKASRCKAHQIRPVLKRTPLDSASRSPSSRSVISGCRRICSPIHSAIESVTRLNGPCRQRGASISPVRVRRAEIFLAQPTLTLNRSATSSSVSSPSSYACKNFRRRSFE